MGVVPVIARTGRVRCVEVKRLLKAVDGNGRRDQLDVDRWLEAMSRSFLENK